MPTVSELNALSQELFLPGLSINFGSQNVVFKMLKNKGKKLQGGPKIVKSVAYQYNKGGAFGRGTQMDLSGEQNATAAKYKWKYYYWPVSITLQDEAENSGPTQIHDLMETKMQVLNFGATEMLANHLLNGYYAGTGFPNSAGDGRDASLVINSLDHALDDSSATLTTLLAGGADDTYGEIDKGNDTWWGGNVTSFGGAAHGPVYSNLALAYTKAHDGDIRPNVGLINPVGFDAYLGSQQSQQQFSTTQQTPDLLAGFRAAMFNGIPLYADKHVASESTVTASKISRVYFLNTDFMDIVTHSSWDMKLKDGSWQAPIDQGAKVAVVIWAGNIITWDPRRHSVGYDFEADDQTA